MKDNIQIEDFREGLKVETLQATVVKPVVWTSVILGQRDSSESNQITTGKTMG
jgi:hypothetical protein